ncbi:hypothetical protein [Pseudomonas xantholysinigenes]|uniref:DUF3757 domain-containing protein n=1 Tax=Pseudomonas xantholysinigenes TaxID=2745490 RepID=A0A9E6PTM3_9PSED|nr:hypothetical protein [Pseudomonas xantholysinigenes]QXI36868.1 hypothetical protein HU772_016105 [Pseudomonas xantholysinigenes]
MRMIGTTLLALFMVGNAVAATCPNPPAEITETKDGQGYAYSAEGGWKGDNPMGNAGDKDTFKFTGAKITTTSVICRYEGDNDGGTSLTLAGAKQADGDGWKNGECASSNVKVCTFK